MRPRTQNSVDEIKRFVSAGHAQSAGNCRVLIDRITELEQEKNRLKKELLALRGEQ